MFVTIQKYYNNIFFLRVQDVPGPTAGLPLRPPRLQVRTSLRIGVYIVHFYHFPGAVASIEADEFELSCQSNAPPAKFF